MENLFLFLATSLVLRIANPKFKRYLIGQSGCSALLPTEGNTLHIKYTDEGDKIYFNDNIINNVRFGLICIQMKSCFDLTQAETILIQYMNRVRKPFSIAHNISIETEKSAKEIAITDYWQDKDGIDWKITGFTNGKIVAVLYVKNIGAATVKEHDAFLHSFRFV